MIEREEVEIIGHLRIEYIARYEQDSYEVECHGYHTITDLHEKCRKIEKIYVCVDDFILEITNKLSRKELQDLQEYLSNT
jgi:hypothetical protein